MTLLYKQLSERLGFYVEEMKIDAVGGSLVLQQVPVVVLNVPNPLSPANVIDAIIGMHVFAGRNLVIDAIPAAVGMGSAPSLYISDPVTDTHQWSTAAAAADWSTAGSWSSAGVPSTLWVAQVGNVSGSDQRATRPYFSWRCLVRGRPGCVLRFKAA